MLAAWSRDSWLVRTNSPALVMRLANFVTNRCRTSSGKLVEVATGQWIVTLEFTLFTFCPPGPLLRAKVKRISLRGIWILALTTIMGL